MKTGLLDFVGTPEGQGLLAAAFGGLAGARRGQPINSIGRAGLAGLAGYGNAQDRIGEAETRAQNNELRQLQVGAYKRQMSEAEAAAAEKARIEGLLRDSFLPTTGTNANARTGITGPRPEAAQAIGAAPAINYQQLIAQGVPVDRVRGLAEAQNFGRSKVARTAEVEGPNGTKRIVQLDDYGQEVGPGMDGYVAPVQINTGDKVVFAKPNAGQAFKMGMSPAEVQANARGWATVNQGAERLRMDRETNGVNGYTFNADMGGYVPKVPGGRFVPLDGAPAGASKLTESEGKNTLYLSQMREASNALDKLEKDGSVSPMVVAATGSPYTNWMAGAKGQQVGQTQRQWAEAYLRAKTGAAATAGEVDNNIRTFFPVVGDDPASVERKRQARMQAEQDMEIPAGRGAARAVARTPQAEPPATVGPYADPAKESAYQRWKAQQGAQ